MLAQGQVGPVAVADGTNPPARMGRTAEVSVQELHGRYYEAAFRKNLFTAYSAGTAMTVVGTGMVGLQIWNGSPVVNGVNLVLLKVSGFISVTSATTTGIVLATGIGQVNAPTGQTAITRSGNNFIGATASQALALNAGTFSNAPTAVFVLMHNTAAIASTGEDIGFNMDLEGSIIIPPQSYACLATLGATAAAAAVTCNIMWEEVPV